MAKSTYQTKKGTMVQKNFVLPIDIANKFTELCNGDPASVILAQWVREKYAEKVLRENGGDYTKARQQLTSTLLA